MESSKILLVLIGPHIPTYLRSLIGTHVLNDDFLLVLVSLQKVDGLIEIATKLSS